MKTDSRFGDDDNFDNLTLLTPEETPPRCFLTDERYFCSDKCRWSNSCKALTAAWLRRN